MNAKTPKQMLARVQTLLRGIDNSVLAIEKHKTFVDDAVKEVKSLVGGIEDVTDWASDKSPESKPVVNKLESKKKPEMELCLGKPKLEKATKVAVPTSVTSTKVKKAPVDGRPSLKEVVRQIVANDSMSAAEIWNQATEKWGYWSRQSLYNVLKDGRLFSKQDDKFSLANHFMDEAEKFIKQVADNQVVKNVQ
jgi:hypothetical protein